MLTFILRARVTVGARVKPRPLKSASCHLKKGCFVILMEMTFMPRLLQLRLFSEIDMFAGKGSLNVLI